MVPMSTKGTTTNSLGVATVPTTLQQAGLVEISATLASDDNYGEASGDLNIAVQMPKAIGIVVAGGGTSDVSFSQMSAAADYAYDTLLARGVPAERIAYLHPEYGEVDNGRRTMPQQLIEHGIWNVSKPGWRDQR